MKTRNWTKIGFNLWSSVYDCIAWLSFAGALQAATSDWLERLPSGRNVVILGGGTGWYLPDLLRRRTDIRITYIDMSQGMLDKAVKVVQSSCHSDRVKFCCCSVFDHQAMCCHTGSCDTGPCDTVLAFFFLDMFRPHTIECLIEAWRAKEGGPEWLVLDFNYPTHLPTGFRHRLWQWLAAALVSAMYLLFRTTCGIEASKLPNLDAAFLKSGYAKSLTKDYCHGLMRGYLFAPIEEPPRGSTH